MMKSEDHVKLIDEGFIASWSKTDAEMIKRVAQSYRLGYIGDIQAERFFSDLETSMRHKWNDKRSPYEFFEPIEVSYKEDKITDYGLSLFCSAIVGKPIQHISHMGIGDGPGATYDYQDVMYSELVRYAFGDEGYINSLGRTLRFHMTFDIMLASATFTEIALFNNPNLGVGPMISRSEFNPGIEHTSGYNYITGSYLISTLSA